ncbi:hypothetical protein [Cupriavidus pampae]|uniref:SLATT domain-containing protein n=1 Tax=Cupriavidus pampae TaxID=659251 RepID=A0ABN7XTS3_9BURK|nr:hypothetical protein [Cupriavidus pampae]CAG9164195.1 hypothetical protein LMG32289_00535 [Cupriavidus pampae]
MDNRIQEIVVECQRQQESCTYTSTALYSWLKEVRVYRVGFITLPIVFGSVASAKILLKGMEYEWVTAVAALLAGLFPAIFKALDLDVSIKAMSDSAHRFEVLRDRFRQAAFIGATKQVTELEEEFRELMARMDEARNSSLAIPERHFNKAKTKIEAGHYEFGANKNSQPSRLKDPP